MKSVGDGGLFERAASEPGPNPAATPQAISVSEALTRARDAVEGLKSFWLEGEVGDLRPWKGFLFFTLKDDKSSLRCVLAPEWSRVTPYTPEKPGEKVLAWVRFTVFEKRGELQAEVLKMEPVGAGALALALQKLKEKLAREGVFSQKRPLPLYPVRVGLVTAAAGAARRDIEKVASEDPGLRLILTPVRVQGEGAAQDIAAALRRLSDSGELDLILLARGGGSQEDLAAFQTEEVARALFESKVPTISAVGHEVDVTLADLACDKRAATPTQGAQFILARRREALERLESASARLGQQAREALAVARRRIAGLRLQPLKVRWLKDFAAKDKDMGEALSRMRKGLSRKRTEGARRLAEAEMGIPLALKRALTLAKGRARVLGVALRNAQRLAVEGARSRWQKASEGLEARSPLAVLARGYSLVRDVETGLLLKEARATAPGRNLSVRLSRGSLSAVVKEVHDEGR